MKRTISTAIITTCIACALVGSGGCKKENAEKASGNPSQAKRTTLKTSVGPGASPVAPTLDEGWCGGHGVPESVCTRCNSTLIPKFKQAGDWCTEHGLPESQCTTCHPDVEQEWAKLNPAASSKPFGPASSPVAPTMDEGWCGGHDVPESVCTRCNSSLIQVFKDAGDWCAEHGLPETQCTVYHPDVEQEWAKLNPSANIGTQHGDSLGKSHDSNSEVRVERVSRILTGSNDPLCEVEDLRVRFIDKSIFEKAGIVVEHVSRRRMSASLAVPGELEFDATKVTRITPRMSGVLLDVPANVGAEVAIGDVLAVVDSPILGEAKSQFIERSQNFKLAEADLIRVRTIFEGVKRMLEVCTPEEDSDKVREALTGSQVGDAKARLLRAHAALQFARADEARAADLLQKELSSTRNYQAAKSALAAAEVDFIAIQEEIRFSIEREQLAAERAAKVARSALESAERRLHILGLDEDQVSRIGTESHELLSRLELRSSAAGRVIERTGANGESVEATDVLFVVADTTAMWLMMDVYERDLVQLRTGQPVMFTVDGMPGIGFEGSVNWISSQVDDLTRTVRLRADLQNDDGLLRAQMFGHARIVLHENEAVVAVPSKAIQTDGCCQLAFVRESDTVFQPRKVLLGSQSNGFVEIIKGLEEGDAVVSTGSFLMKTEILKGNIGAGCCEVETGR